MNRLTPSNASVAAAFSAAAATYEGSADVQFNVAGRLGARIANLSRPAAPRILEIGCGTGFLSRDLRKRIPEASWTITDISSQMLDRCRANLEAQDDTSFKVMDGEAPNFASTERFDLICSSLAFQWFENLPSSLSKLSALLAPGGHIAFATLAENSFSEWRQAYTAVGADPAVLKCLSRADIEEAMPKNGTAYVDEEYIAQPYANGHSFLRKLRQIGADTPRPGHHPAPAGTLRRVLRAFDSGPNSHVTYHVAYGVFRQR